MITIGTSAHWIFAISFAIVWRLLWSVVASYWPASESSVLFE
ncbi:hypothetical protein [Frondihabitans sp. PAMC 28766]|nr:hypothetical protein [Frondihabitans sp. PAMC 28766]